MRISVLSSDVCAADLKAWAPIAHPIGRACLCRDGEGLDRARQILVALLRTAELARAGARQGARRDQLDEAVHAGDRADAVADRLAQRDELGIVAGATLDEHRRGLDRKSVRSG